MNHVRSSGMNFGFAALAATVVAAQASIARSDAPADRYSINAGTVLDARTGLTWQQDAEAASYTQSMASTYCDSLSLAGRADWRLPTVSELLTLVDPTLRGPAIDRSAFFSATSEAFWSATPFVGRNDEAWYVEFDYGFLGHSLIGQPYRVRCVRSAPSTGQ